MVVFLLVRFGGILFEFLKKKKKRQFFWNFYQLCVPILGRDIFLIIIIFFLKDEAADQLWTMAEQLVDGKNS